MDWNGNRNNVAFERIVKFAIKRLRGVDIKIRVNEEYIFGVIWMSACIRKSIDDAFFIGNPDAGIQFVTVIA